MQVVNTRRLERNDVILAKIVVQKFHGREVSADYMAKFLSNPSNFLIIAEMGGEITGFVLAYQLDRLERDAAAMFIYEIEVEEEHRRRGAGAALINHIRQIADEGRMLETFVFTNYSNQAAVAFYQATGGQVENGDDLLFVYPGTAGQG